MNVYEAMGQMREGAELGSIADALEVLHATADAYDALAPDWANAPDWAQWYAIDSQFWSNGTAPACFYQNEPHLVGDEWSSKLGEQMPGDSSVEIPLGIDWRLCKWSREVTK